MKQRYYHQNNPYHVSMIRPLRLFPLVGLLIVTWLVSFNAYAVDYTLPAAADAGIGPFSNCTGPVGGPFTCAGNLQIVQGDTVTLSAPVTLTVTAEFKVDDFGGPVNAAGVYTMNVFANKGHIDGDEIVNINLTASGDITVHKSATVVGDLTSTGGDLKIDNDSTVDGICDPDHPQCNNGPGSGLSCETTKISAGGEEFKAISGNSDDNVFAVGKNGSIYHYNGTSWTNVYTAPGGKELRDITVLASGEAWAVGKSGTVLYYDSTVWTPMVPASPTGKDLRGVWALSSTEVWIVGKNGTLWMYDGAIWNDMSAAAGVGGNELRSAWGNLTYFYAVEKDGDLYRYQKAGGTWTKQSSCALNVDIERMWGDGSGSVYLVGKDKAANQSGIFLYDENTTTCSLIHSSPSTDKFNGVDGNGAIVYAVGKSGTIVQNTTGSWVETTDGTQEIKDVWVSSSNTAYYAAKGGFVSSCTNSNSTTLDHFTVTPATTSASTCLTNPITIEAINPDGDPVVDFTSLISISVNRNHGNWSRNPAPGSSLGLLAPEPDADDNGAVDYTFDVADASSIILDLSNTHAETVTVTVTDGTESTTSVPIQFSKNTFVLTEDPIQIAGRPQAMTIDMIKDDPSTGSCGIDANYNSAGQSLVVSIDRSGVLPAALDPSIGGVGIPDTPPLIGNVTLDFSTGTPGQASFNLDTTDVGKYRLIIQDTSLVHSDVNIFGTSAELTVRPFGLAVTNITGIIPNPDPPNNTSGGAVFALAGTDFSARVEAVLWDTIDDTNNDGVLDMGVYADNVKAPSYAWATTLGVPSPAMGFWPTAGAENGVQGSFINGSLVQGDFVAGTASPTNLQYDEVGSFTLQSMATNYLNTLGADFNGDDIIVGRFIPASFSVTKVQDGMFAGSCAMYAYIGEGFSYDILHPAFLVTAMNGLTIPTPTSNYTGNWAKLVDASVTFTPPTADLNQNGSDTVTKMAISYTQDTDFFTITDNSDGSHTFEFEDDNFVYDKDSNSEIANFNTEVELDITDVTDTEMVTNSGNLILKPTFIDMRFGRLRMGNVHGSELSTLDMPMQVEYLNSAGVYTVNSLDNCTTIDTAHLAISDNMNPPASSTATVTNTMAVAGDLGVGFTAPGTAGFTGYMDITPDLAGSVDSWLQYDWTTGTGTFNENPTARATFGIYKGNDVNIYKSQVYQ